MGSHANFSKIVERYQQWSTVLKNCRNKEPVTFLNMHSSFGTFSRVFLMF